MSAIRQVRIPQQEEISAPAAERDRENPLELLRDAIARLKSSDSGVPDEAEVAYLLAEAREVLERAKVIARAVSQCETFLGEGQFGKAFEALDAGLLVFPGDPALLARRREVEARAALQEANWLYEQDRVDLAAQFLREKAEALANQETVVARLEELEALLPVWEQKRHAQAALARAASLEQLSQWQAALTVLEEALQAYPASEELLAGAQRVRECLVEHERRKKLARRLELIAQKIAAQSWRQALTLVESTRAEFPGAPELAPLRREIDAGVRQAECDAVVAEVRQHMADGELDQAEAALRQGRKLLGAETALEALREELLAEKKYRDDLRTAQVLFGRRQLPEAEQILAQLVAEGRPEARALLEAVREARAAMEEENFLENGRQKALELIQQQQFAAAADLLCNLLLLFPGNPFLERDLSAAQAGLEPKAADTAPAAGHVAAPEPEPLPELQTASGDDAPVREIAPSRFRRAAIAGTASLLLVSAGGAAWKLTRGDAPVSRPPQQQEAAQVSSAAAASEPSVTEPPDSPPPVSLTVAADPATSKSQTQPAPERAAALRQFVPPGAKATASQASALPAPPGAEPAVSAVAIPGLPVAEVKPSDVLAPPAPAQAPVAKPVLPPGGNFQQAELMTRTLPEYPMFARTRGVYGMVRMDAVIDEHGEVKNVKILAGDPVLAAAAKKTVLTWRYKPATLNGKPIAANVAIQIVFGDRSR